VTGSPFKNLTGLLSHEPILEKLDLVYVGEVKEKGCDITKSIERIKELSRSDLYDLWVVKWVLLTPLVLFLVLVRSKYSKSLF
jgi:hypothetical protein